MNLSAPFPRTVLALTWFSCALALALGFSTIWISLLLLGLLGVVGIEAFAFQERPNAEADTSVHEIPNGTTPPSTITEDSFARASFLAKVSHELRTPLHNILGLLNIVYKNDSNATNRYYLRLMQDASSALLGTINDVLDYSKSDTGMLTVECKPMDLAETVRQALRAVSPRVADKVELELLCSWGQDVPTQVRSDSVRVRQVLVNLLGNAIKFTTSGQVTLTVLVDRKTDQGWILRFCVSDTGIGIPPSKLHTIFDPFSQVDMTVVRRCQGTGLGLTIVRQLVSALNGEVSVTSVLGKGSEFTVMLPVKSSATQRPPQFSLVGTGTLCVLSGSPMLGDLLCRELSEYGAKTFFTNCPLSFLQIATKDIKHLVVTDSALTNDNSWKMIDDFVEQRGSNDLVVLLTPASIHFRERCLHRGIKNLLTLPVLPRDIVSSLHGECPEDLLGSDASNQILRAREPLNILIADDIATNQLILRTVLEEAGHRVRAVSDGEALFDLIRHQVDNVAPVAKNELFDVVLTDIQMPKMDGVTVIQRTRALESSRSVDPLPLIAVTAHAFQAERDRILNAGATGIVTKPLNVKELEELINSVIPRSERPSVATVISQMNSAPTLATASPPHDPFVALVEKAVAAAVVALGAPVELDIAGVFDRSGNSVRRTLLILRSFVDGYGELLAALHYREGENSAEELGKVAHSLKGILSEVGATTAQAQAFQAEQLGRDGKIAELVPLLEALKDETERVAAVVRVVIQEYDQKNQNHQAMRQ